MVIKSLRSLAVVFAAMVCASIAYAEPIFDELYPPSGGDLPGDYFGIWYYSGPPRSLIFDPATDQLRYNASWDQDSQNYNYTWSSASGDQFFAGSGVLDWTAQLNSSGTELIGGGASLFLDFGLGLELAAVGNVSSLGAREVTCFDVPEVSSPYCYISVPQVTIEPSYVDVRGESFLGNYWLWEGFYDFRQPALAYTQSLEASLINWSGDQIFSYKVAEPGTLALLGIGLAGMGLARRRKQVA